MKYTLNLFFSLSLFFFLSAYAQDKEITGKITDEDNNSLPGVSILVKGTTQGTVSDLNGAYSLKASENATLIFSFIGYKTQEVEVGSNAVLDIILELDKTDLSEVVVIGSRNVNRTVLETAVPVDIISIDEIVRDAPQIEIGQILNYVAPSFSSNRQTISDGTDHVDPASLRGLGVDHVLVLINGKRRHTSSLVNVNGTFGRGSVGTDLNTIPAAAIQRIEVLRDGAAAQYGSDAIAGVINIVLKETTDKVSVNVTGGQTYMQDGENLKVSANYGYPIGKKGGFVNLTGQYQFRGRTDRSGEYNGSVFLTDATGLFRRDFQAGELSPYNPGVELTAETAAEANALNSLLALTESDEDALIASFGGRRRFSLRAGDSEAINTALYLNSVLPINDEQEFYVFGGLNSRSGLASGFYRLPNQSRNVLAIYELGFLPEINSDIFDGSIGAGLRGKTGEWNTDFSTVYGTNRFLYNITNTLNASLGQSSPQSFFAGGFQFSQSTTNLDFNRYKDDWLSGVNIAFGAEYRVERYQIYAGEEGSYTNYGNVPVIDTLSNGTLYQSPVAVENIFFGRPAGSQVFPGFQPGNELNQTRSNVAFYTDWEFNFSKQFFVSVAGRYEYYSDFGSTLNGKIAARYDIIDDVFALRGAVSTGFRAPSLHQRYFNSTSTIFTLQGGVSVPNEVGTFRNDSRIAELFGIPSLENETSTNFSFGFTLTPATKFNITVDGYLVNVDNRVVLTGQFNSGSSPEIAGILASVNAGRAQLFSNAINTETMGLDLILTYDLGLGSNSNLKITLAGNLNQTEVAEINVPGELQTASEASFFSREERSRFESSVPRSKFNLTFNYNLNNKLFVTLNNVYFGEVTALLGTDDNPIDQTFAGKIVSDLSIGYQISKVLNVTVGVNNLLDVVPDENREEFRSSNRFLYSRRVSQFSANGGFYFGRLNFTF